MIFSAKNLNHGSVILMTVYLYQRVVHYRRFTKILVDI